MKSIKEMAEEYTSAIENQVTNNAAFLAYKSGANYVLEKIEKELPLNDKCLNDYGKALVWRLKECVKQLKQ